jgi:hypothetical protein
MHRKPLPATVKRLYGTASRCGKPDCGRPLYKLDTNTGESVLNSTVSHICARDEGGPRWDPSMSEEDNRSEANLIALCLEHAHEIDASPGRFPGDLLREWKRAQLAEHFRQQKGWQLTDDDAQEVIDGSFSPQDFARAVAVAAGVTAAAHAAERLVETARQQRLWPAEAAQAWQTMREHVQLDLHHGPITVAGEHEAMQTAPFQPQLNTPLRQAEQSLHPLVSILNAELHAVRGAAGELTLWCDRVEAAAVDVLAASGHWPRHSPEDDDTLTKALAELMRASAAFLRAWQGQPVEEPSEPEPS